MYSLYSSYLCTHLYQSALENYRKAKKQTWIGKASELYDWHFEEVLGDLGVLGSLISEWEAARVRLEAML